MPAIPSKFPLNIYDELLFHLDQPSSPLVQHMEVHVTPRIDAKRLHQALLTATAEHPIMQMAMAPYSPSDSQFFWQQGDPLIRIPLAEKEAVNIDDITTLRNEFYSGAIALIEPPPFRCLLVHTGEEQSILMLKASNVATDSVGLQLFLTTILSLYAGVTAPQPRTDFLAIRNQHLQPQPNNANEGVKAIGKLLEALNATLKPPARIAATGREDATGVGIAPIAFSAAQTKALKVQQASATELSCHTLAALHLAVEEWNQAHQQKTGNIRFIHPINTRKEPWQESIASNLSMWVNISSQTKDRQNAAELLQLMQSQTEQLFDEGVLHLLVDLAQEIRRLPAWLRQIVPGLLPLTGGRLTGTAVVGSLEPMTRLQTQELSVKEWFFSPPCRMPMGASLGAVIYDHRLHLSLRYHQQQFSQDDAWAFAEIFLNALNQIA